MKPLDHYVLVYVRGRTKAVSGYVTVPIPPPHVIDRPAVETTEQRELAAYEYVRSLWEKAE